MAASGSQAPIIPNQPPSSSQQPPTTNGSFVRFVFRCFHVRFIGYAPLPLSSPNGMRPVALQPLPQQPSLQAIPKPVFLASQVGCFFFSFSDFDFSFRSLATTTIAESSECSTIDTIERHSNTTTTKTYCYCCCSSCYCCNNYDTIIICCCCCEWFTKSNSKQQRNSNDNDNYYDDNDDDNDSSNSCCCSFGVQTSSSSTRSHCSKRSNINIHCINSNVNNHYYNYIVVERYSTIIGCCFIERRCDLDKE